MTFAKWIDTFIEEKGIDPEQLLVAVGPSGTNLIPVGCIVEMIKQTAGAERAKIKQTIVRIDFHNGDVRRYFRHLAQAVAL